MPAEVLADLRRVGEVDADAHLGRKAVVAPMCREGALDGDRARQRVVGRVEADEEAIAGGNDLVSAMRCEQAAQRLVVPRAAASTMPRRQAAQRGWWSETMSVNMNVLTTRRVLVRARDQLPGQDLADLLEGDRERGARQRGLADDLLVDAVDVDDLGLGEVAAQPVEDGRGDGDAVACADAHGRSMLTRMAIAAP